MEEPVISYLEVDAEERPVTREAVEELVRIIRENRSVSASMGAPEDAPEGFFALEMEDGWAFLESVIFVGAMKEHFTYPVNPIWAGSWEEAPKQFDLCELRDPPRRNRSVLFSEWQENLIFCTFSRDLISQSSSSAHTSKQFPWMKPVLRRNVLRDPDLVAECVLHYALTGELYPRLVWESEEDQVMMKQYGHRDILLLGDPKLYEVSEPVLREELEELRPVFQELFNCIRDFRRKHGFGRAIAAPQIGVQKRLICMLTDRPRVIINPELEFVGEETMEVMDDCMSFPGLLVRVKRHRRCILRYLNENWEPCEEQMEDDMAELIQHEYDHLDGILATMRAVDSKAFVMKPQNG